MFTELGFSLTVRSQSDSAIERRRDGFPKSLWPGLRVAAGHANVAVSEYQLHTIQRHGSVEQRRCTRVAQSVLQVGS